ncbi:MAG: DUF378 domain-containing protein [Candidatus Pacebacteria bacterium]|jgi:uncharacterized membrane protein YuzA (DUF378 family)|nr:DUF378 domain-containing protein [Candidatus Paceibacterota bacterium]
MSNNSLKISQKILKEIAFAFVLIGAVNWGLIGLSGVIKPFRNLNLVNLVFGDYPMVEFFVYILVGVCGLYLLLSEGRDFGKK